MTYLQLTTRFHTEECNECNGKGAIGHIRGYNTCNVCSGVGKIEHITVERINESNQNKN